MAADAHQTSRGADRYVPVLMPILLAIGELVSWNSEAGRLSGTIVAIHTEDFDYKGHVHHVSADEP